MKISANTIIIDDYPSKGESLLYHTRTQAMVKIESELKKFLNNLAGLKEVCESELFKGELENLYEMGIIVQDKKDDQEKRENFLNHIKTGVRKKSLPVTILTTYDCNFKCVYCFEEAARQSIKMDYSVADQVREWIFEKTKKLGYESLFLNFYGGEPLMNMLIIDYFCNPVREQCKEANIGFGFSLQTNGYLLAPELVDYYLSKGLRQVQISLDGLKDVHNKKRPLRSGGGTFDIIIKNIMSSVDKVKIGISCGYEGDDISHIEDLVDYFEKLGILHKLDRFIFSPIHSTLGPRGCPDQIQNGECMVNYKDENLIKANRKIDILMKNKGIKAKKGMHISLCSLTRNNGGVTIDPLGEIYKCNSMLGHSEFSVGHVSDTSFNLTHEMFNEIDAWKKCPQECVYLPMCSGGCRLASFLEHKNFDEPVCHKKFLDEMSPQYIKDEYEKLVGKCKTKN